MSLRNLEVTETAECNFTCLKKTFAPTPSRFSVSAVVSSMKVPTDTELANPEPLLIRELQRQVPVSLSGHVFINQSKHDLALCVLLFKNAYLSGQQHH